MGAPIIIVTVLYLLHLIGWLVPIAICAGILLAVAAVWMTFAAAVCFLLNLIHSGD